MRRLAVLSLGWVVAVPSLQAQRAERHHHPVLREAVSVATGGGLALLSRALPAPTFPTCGPCPTSEIPGFDRWALSRERTGVEVVGWASLGALTAYSWYDMARDPATGFSHIRGSFESAFVAGGVALVLKETFHRRRPAYFTDEVVGQSESQARDNLRSLPSGDTSVAFAVATSYLLSRGSHLTTLQRVIVLAGATVTGVARVAGGKHFPSDVLAGAAVGVGSAVLVHQIRF